MNEVYISGFVSGNPVLKMERENVPHFLFSIDICHRTKSGKTHREMYTVNAWHNVALRAAEKLKIGQFVMLRGYLTQRLIQANELSYTLTELTVRDFVSSGQRQEIDEAVQEKPQGDSAAQTVETESAVEA